MRAKGRRIKQRAESKSAAHFFIDNVCKRGLKSKTVKRRTYQPGDIVEMLRKMQGERSMRQFAADLGISTPYLSELYRGSRKPGAKVLKHLGLVKKLVPTEPVYEAV